MNTRTTVEPKQDWVKRGAELERQITQTALAIGELDAKTANVRSEEDLQKLRSQIDFSEVRRRALIGECIEVDRSRRQQRLDDVERPADPMPELLAEKKQLEVRQDEVLRLIQTWSGHAAQARRIEQHLRSELERFDADVAPELRKRLEALGR